MPAKKILIRGVNWLGDAVMTAPALSRLRECFPASEICLLAPAKLAELWTNHPAVNRTISFVPGESIWKVAAKLKRECFDVALVFPNSFRSALETWLARVPERIGYGRGGRGLFLTKAIPPRSEAIRMRKRSDREIRNLIAASAQRQTYPATAHHMHQYLRLAAEVGANLQPIAPSIVITKNELEEFRAKFRIKRGEALLSLNPGAEYGPAKRWPAESFIAAALAVQEHFRGIWLLLGGAKDIEVCENIAVALRKVAPPNRVLNLAGKTTLRELGAALAGSRVLLTNDTGPMHLAAAVGTRVVGIFGSTSLELTGPGVPDEGRHLLLSSPVGCAPCFRRDCPIDFRCMSRIAPQTAANAVIELLNAPV